MINRILLDLDGVVIDYCGAVIKYFDLGVLDNSLLEYNSIEKIYMEKTGDTRSGFWKRQGEDFWMSLPMYPWAEELLEMLKPYKPIIATAPTLNNAGWRQHWIMKNMPDYFHDKRYLIGPAKWAAASRSTLLIDDKPGNLEAFTKAGGHVLMFPQPWNVGTAALKKDRFEWFKTAFEFYKDCPGIEMP